MEIIEYTCRYFGITKDGLINKTDYRHTLPRHIAWYFMHKELSLSNKQIGDAFGRNRRSVIHGITYIKYRIMNQKEYKDIYDSFAEKYKKETAK